MAAHFKTQTHISIHALLAESDFKFFPCSTHNSYFYPRSPCGERRGKPAQPQHCTHHFYPRSPCGERLYCMWLLFQAIMHFYPRSPCGERQKTSFGRISILTFLSTLSLRRATLCPTHGQAGHVHFYPRSPCGERRRVWVYLARVSAFLSTLSLRRATPNSGEHCQGRGYFYPRSPCGERQQGTQLTVADVYISIHALLAESDNFPAR